MGSWSLISRASGVSSRMATSSAFATKVAAATRQRVGLKTFILSAMSCVIPWNSLLRDCVLFVKYIFVIEQMMGAKSTMRSEKDLLLMGQAARQRGLLSYIKPMTSLKTNNPNKQESKGK